MSEKTQKKENIAVRAVKAYISKSILPTYGRFSRGRSQMNNCIIGAVVLFTNFQHNYTLTSIEYITVCCLQ